MFSIGELKKEQSTPAEDCWNYHLGEVEPHDDYFLNPQLIQRSKRYSRSKPREPILRKISLNQEVKLQPTLVTISNSKGQLLCKFLDRS